MDTDVLTALICATALSIAAFAFGYAVGTVRAANRFRDAVSTATAIVGAFAHDANRKRPK